MDSNDKYCLRWNDFESNITHSFQEIRDDKDLLDITLSCGSRQIQAHKLMLSACSPFFRTVLKQNPHQHPLLYLKDVRFVDLQSVLTFMYNGEVNVAQEDLNSFLSTAEELQVKGLTQSSNQKALSTNNLPQKESGPCRQFGKSQSSVDTLQLEHTVIKSEQQPVYNSESSEGNSQIVRLEEENYIDDGLDYGSYLMDDQNIENAYDGYDNYPEASAETYKESTETLIQQTNGQFECAICGRGFPLKITCRRHVQNVHSDNQRVLCHVCNKYMKNSGTLKAHLRGAHGIYQGGKTK